MSKKYEALVIFSDVVRDDALEAAVERFANELKAFGAEIESCEAIGRKTFARTLGKRDHGLYGKVRFDADPAAIAKMRERFRLYEDVYRIQFRTRNLRVEAAKAKDDARRAAYNAAQAAKAEAAAAQAAADAQDAEPAG
ncbi:MAG: 30S ribosomal protein S6 [Kiritimatiellae bacterium]|nr:30S ribosomal protein S6 [Kiritimatiellia bacterium]